jgi:hypothetical protein
MLAGAAKQFGDLVGVSDYCEGHLGPHQLVASMSR